jgi:peptidoglycan/LPS O-acetylase OafA/YrhL
MTKTYVVCRDSNSLDFLRLIAAVLVLYSHQFALLGSTDPSFFGWTTFGGAGVTIFFFLSGMLVWSREGLHNPRRSES